MANNDIVFNWGKVNRNLPGANTDETYAPMRVGRRGEVITKELDRYALADEGTLFYAHNNTNDASTTLAGHAAPVLADADVTMTKPLIVARNTVASTSLVRSYLDYIEIEVVTAGANGTQACWAAQCDSGADRYSSGTVETFTAYNANMQSSNTPTTTWRGGPFVAGAESSAVRYLGHGTLRPSIEIAGDKYLFLFGRDPAVANSTAAAAVRSFIVNLPAVILGPTDMFLLALHGQASQNAAGIYKVRMVWSER
jgi:hypothetical protein